MRKYIYICDLCGKEYDTDRLFRKMTISSVKYTKLQPDDPCPVDIPLLKAAIKASDKEAEINEVLNDPVIKYLIELTNPEYFNKETNK